MKTITVTRVVKAPPEKVFDMLADHANYRNFPGIKDSRLIREGKAERNGVGALREITAMGAWFQEEITHYDRPKRLDYQIVKARPPMDHEGGSVRIAPHAQGCQVTWTTKVHIAIPLIGSLLDKLVLPQLEKGLHGTLKHIEQRLAA